MVNWYHGAVAFNLIHSELKFTSTIITSWSKEHQCKKTQTNKETKNHTNKTKRQNKKQHTCFILFEVTESSLYLELSLILYLANFHVCFSFLMLKLFWILICRDLNMPSTLLELLCVHINHMHILLQSEAFVQVMWHWVM